MGKQQNKVLVETRNLTRLYRAGEVEVRALSGIDLKVDRGEFLVILGPSGSGKTTLLNILGGIDSPTSGKVLVNGVDISGYKEVQLSRYRRQTVGWVFQFFNLIPSLTAGENVALALEMAGDSRDKMKRAGRALELVGIGDKFRMFPSQLSGGEQQRVAIARAMVKSPTLLLADEPTGNLDWVTGLKVGDLMRKLCNEEGITFVVVSHDMSVTGNADRILHMRDGKLSGEDVALPKSKKVMAAQEG